MTIHDEEHTSLTAAVAALGDDAGRQPTVEEIAIQRRHETREKAFEVIDAALVAAGHNERVIQVVHIVHSLEAHGLVIVQRRPE